MASIPQNVTLWPYRRIPYTFEPGFPFKKDVRRAMDKWQNAAGVSFVERVNEPNYLMISRPQKGGSSSAVGMKGGRQDVIIGNDYIGLHELGHALGLIHEQSRCDRDDYIEVLWCNIEKGEENINFKIHTKSHNLTEYDRKSVMHYPAPATGWQGRPSGSNVWTMLWKKNNKTKLGPDNWSDLSRLDKNPKGLRAAYNKIPVPMGPETDHGYWKNPYATQFPFTVNGKQFFYGQNQNTNYWFIQELLSDGKMGPETDHGKWRFAYGTQFSFTIGNRVFFYGQNMKEKNWFIQELLPDGKMGPETDHGKWKFAYKVQFPFVIDDSVFFYGQNMKEKNWFIQELLPGGKMGTETDHGKWGHAYAVQFHYKINHNLYFYGQNIDTNYWFIQRLHDNGTMGDEIQGGFWKYPYGVQFPFKLGQNQYFYGQKISSGYNWFIQQLMDV